MITFCSLRSQTGFGRLFRVLLSPGLQNKGPALTWTEIKHGHKKQIGGVLHGKPSAGLRGLVSGGGGYPAVIKKPHRLNKPKQKDHQLPIRRVLFHRDDSDRGTRSRAQCHNELNSNFFIFVPTVSAERPRGRGGFGNAGFIPPRITNAGARGASWPGLAIFSAISAGSVCLPSGGIRAFQEPLGKRARSYDVIPVRKTTYD